MNSYDEWMRWKLNRGNKNKNKRRKSRFLYHCYIVSPPPPPPPPRPNIWGRVTDGPLFASHHRNVLPALAPMSINGRHVPKHTQHTKRTLWLEEMDCARDWQGTLQVSITKGPLFYPSSIASITKTCLFTFIRLCMSNTHSYDFSLFVVGLFYIWFQDKKW